MNEYGEEEEQEQRKTLLDVVCSHLLRDKPILSRIMFAGRRTHKEEPLKEVFVDLTNSAKYGYEGKIVFTGLFVETPSNFIHFLEGEPKNLHSLLANLANNSNHMDKVDDVQVFSYTDDIIDRSWPQWKTLEVNLPGKHMSNTSEQKATTEIVNQVKRFTDLGGQIFTKEKLQIETYLANAKNSHPDLLPTIGLIEGILETGFCLTLAEYLQLYHSPVGIDLQSENIWPAPQPLKY
mmetsp:Transcript_123566/g.214330  ORF Transcript_123566/g.214330 Transcript_123566/m.214330 type:complete len:236 (-) Transcript_123566:427-1134(-)